MRSSTTPDEKPRLSNRFLITSRRSTGVSSPAAGDAVLRDENELERDVNEKRAGYMPKSAEEAETKPVTAITGILRPHLPDPV
jgi:hypothetical protein